MSPAPDLLDAIRAQPRLKSLEDGGYQYTPKKGVSFTLTAEALVRRLVALVPPPRIRLTIFHGVYAPHAPLWPVVTQPVEPPPVPAPAPAKKPGALTSCAARVTADAPSVPPLHRGRAPKTRIGWLKGELATTRLVLSTKEGIQLKATARAELRIKFSGLLDAQPLMDHTAGYLEAVWQKRARLH